MNKLTGHSLFLVDALGAFISIILLVFLYRFHDFFGMPGNVILIFIAFASALFVYSTTVYFLRPVHWKVYLKIVALLNVTYCLFTVYQIFKNSETLKLFGYFYFAAEVLVILILSTYELNNASKPTAGKQTEI